jgi:hypothetical protein
MSEATPGREPIQIVEIQQPLCSRDFGVAPCTATGTADTKCYNTRATCQDTANFALGTPLSLWFCKDGILPTLDANQTVGRMVDDWILFDGTWNDSGVWRDTAWWKDTSDSVPNLNYTDVDASMPVYLIPSLMGVSTSPTRVNLSASNPDAQGLGNRALCTLRFKDHPHTDRVVDPYVDGRSWDPMDKSRGSFWTRWLVRNKYRKNILIKVYEGYEGQTLAQMKVRSFFMDSATWPDANGVVTIQCKDVLARIEERKAQAPLASPGVLYTAIDASVTSFEVANAVEADYPASGTLRIGDEIMTYTSRATSANGITFSGVTRGTDNSVADSHDVDAGVQECLRYTTQRTDDIVEDLLTTYGGVDASYLDTAGWATEFDEYMSFYLLTALITEPTSVAKLVSELQVQAMFYLWWDERAALVKWKSIRGVEAEPDTLSEETNILAGHFAITEHPRERASQVWVYYDQIDYTKSVDQTAAYESQFVVASLESETDELYGEKAIRKIFGRWLPTDALAQNTASKIITRYVDVPFQARFRLDAKDRDYWIGDTIKISHHKDVDQYGNRLLRQWTIISAEEIVPGEIVEYVAEDTTLYGRIHYVMATGAADYPGYDNAPFKNCYIGDANGLLSDGEEAGRIS